MHLLGMQIIVLVPRSYGTSRATATTDRLSHNLRLFTFSCFRSPKEKKYGMLGPSGVTPCFSLCDAETQFLFGWKSSQKTANCLDICNSVSQLGNKLGNKAIFLKNASLGIRWGISEFW
jgi:hypothetical protein